MSPSHEPFGDILAKVKLYLITDAFPKMQPIERFLTAAISGGVGMVQLRERTLDDKHLLEVATRCAATCRSLQVPFVVNDRADIALACGAQGVHLGQDDLPIQALRELAGERLFVGLSTHTPEQIDEATILGADYIGVGPVHATPTKPGRAAVGIDLVRYAATHATMPHFAIGGLDPRNVAAVLGAGATGVSVLRWISQSEDPQRAAVLLMEACARSGFVKVS